MRNGEVKGYYEDETLEFIANYKDDKRHGESKYYRKDGKMESISYWKDGEDITEQVLTKRELLEEIELI